MDFGAQQESSLTMPIPMNYGSIHESSKFRMLGGPSIHSGSSSISGPPVFPSSAGAQPLRQPLTAPPPPPPPPPPPAPNTANSQANYKLVENRLAAPSTSAGRAGAVTSYTSGPLTSVTNCKKPVKYRQCLKNHAASIGGHALDGCGEFMPSGEEGSLEALKCAACGCHRNFHRREVEGVEIAAGCGLCAYGPHPQLHTIKDHENSRRRITALAALQPPAHASLALPAPPISSAVGAPRSLGPLHVQALHSPPDMQTGDDQSPDPSVSHLHNTSHAMLSMHHHHHFGSSSLKKRFRTKFSSEQKDRMLNFAERLGWRIQKQDEASVHQFCADVGVKRHVFKVWMHNNKNTFSKRISPSEGGSDVAFSFSSQTLMNASCFDWKLDHQHKIGTLQP
ncbi:hypothetical protein GOP47_0026876 [Adiantum capillus-veneris]|nr:hypothetical protein GOP47_0026876 [Adiantum capillus-veneris]